MFYPQIIARAGSYSFDQGVQAEIHSSQDSYFDWAKIRFTEEYQQKIALTRKDTASIELGYNGVYDEAFTGYVSRPYNSGDNADEITLKDDMLLLEETKINNTFLDTTPQEMISYFLAQAGISKMVLSSRNYPEKKEYQFGKCRQFKQSTPYMRHGTLSNGFSSREACSIGERNHSKKRSIPSSMG